MKKKRSAKKPRRQVPKAKAGTIFDALGIQIGELFEVISVEKPKRALPKAKRKEYDPMGGGWGAIFDKLNIKRVLREKIEEEKREKRERAKREAEVKKAAAKRNKAMKKAQIAMDRLRKSAVVAKGDRARKLAILAFKKAKKKWPHAAARLVNAPPDKYPKKAKVKSVEALFDRELWGKSYAPGTKEKVIARTNGYVDFYNYGGKGKLERLSIASLVDLAEDIVQSDDRPKWMTTVEKDAADWKREKEKREAADKKEMERRRKYKPPKFKPPTKAQFEKAKREQDERERKWRTNQAINRANQKWLDAISERVTEQIKAKTGKKPTLDELAAVINAAIKEMGRPKHVSTYPGSDPSTGKASRKLTFGGLYTEMCKLVPGAPEPVVKEPRKSGEEKKEK